MTTPTNLDLETLNLKDNEKILYWEEKTTSATLSRVDTTNVQGMIDAIPLGLTSLDNIIATGTAAEKTLAGILKKVLLFIQSEMT